MSDCCKSGFKWDGKPVGTETKLANVDAYVTGSNKDVAVLIVHDIFGWTFPNVRLLADHYASEAGATVYVGDFFGGEVVHPDTMSDPARLAAFDVGAFLGKNGKAVREPEIAACAKALKQELGFKKVGAVGFCYGGWAVFRLGAKGNALVDCVAANHPSLLEKSEVDAISVPVQVCATENDPFLAGEMIEYINKVIPTLGVEYDYQYFPGQVHGFASRADTSDPKQVKALERAKNATVSWLREHLSS
ncbi:hypothetical protein PV10_04921 [Exophiala mesophila]|uniref:Dienelactone hydrolase domain-containing protein n=1 Tax=Exophiala mesophila TaxID=212818 RepID=A0A0D1XZN1_EXOME|nr:uncharacterized protein PV10_04921 [Exophiala mesophila]KIV93726.1 hypothetical protein PV10_04921 [Exophiala mesophila]